IYHMAELLTKKYRYFFLSSNCAQRLAVLLDIFIEEDVYDFNYPVYVPEELFQRLHTIDRQRRQNGQPALIDDIKYIPSARRHLYYEIERLSPQERQIYTTITDNPDDELTGYLEPLDVEGRINVLNALLAYQYYKWMAEDEANPDQTLKEYKRKILLERLQLPAKEVIPVSIPELPSPKTMPPPSSFNLGFVAETHSDPYATFGATVFRKESGRLNALEFNDLVALSLNIGMFADSDKIFVDTFDFLKIRDYRTFYIPEANEHPFSWRVRAGIDRYNNHNDADYDYLFDSGIGFVNKIKDKGIYYGFLNGGLHTLDQNYRAGPSAGFVIGNDKLKMQNDVGLEFDLENGEYIETFNTSMQYQINQRNALQATFEKTNRERFSLNYIYYW
ncbi:MAG: DUF4105 domain-containing protein, partial [Candidatus Omnitrophica bacterium]|nr:DUF4105 domain-containing protein [Candidatus Omnitrophota bacterium]